MWLMIDFAAPLVGSCQVALDKLKGVDYGYGYFYEPSGNVRHGSTDQSTSTRCIRANCSGH